MKPFKKEGIKLHKLINSSSISQNTGTITLNDSIQNYNIIIIVTGGVGAGTYTSTVCTKFFGRTKWQTGETSTCDVLSGRTYSGNFTIDVTDDTTLTIQSTDLSIRGIYGIK